MSLEVNILIGACSKTGHPGQAVSQFPLTDCNQSPFCFMTLRVFNLSQNIFQTQRKLALTIFHCKSKLALIKVVWWGCRLGRSQGICSNRPVVRSNFSETGHSACRMCPSYGDSPDPRLLEARDLIRATRAGFFCSSDNRASIACNVWGLMWCSIPSTS